MLVVSKNSAMAVHNSSLATDVTELADTMLDLKLISCSGLVWSSSLFVVMFRSRSSRICCLNAANAKHSHSAKMDTSWLQQLPGALGKGCS